MGDLAGGDQKILIEANKRWNVLSTLKEIDQVVKQGNVPAGQLVTKFRRTNKKGLSGFLKGKGTGIDDVDDLADVAAIIAGDPTPIGSETASRVGLYGPGTLALIGVATGDLSPEQAIAIAALPLAAQAIGPAAFGHSLSALSTATGVGVAQEAPGLLEGLTER